MQPQKNEFKTAKPHLLISIVALIFLGFLFSQDSLARLAWQKYRSPQIALSLVRSDEKLAMQLGNYYFNGQKYDLARAEKAFRKAVKADPKILWGHYQLARIHFIKGDYDRALEEINKELVANPENLRALYVRGLIYGYRATDGDLEFAETDFRRFVRWTPKEWAGYNDLSWILAKQGKYREAKESLEVALKKVQDAENNPWLWNSLGVALLNLEDRRGAEKAFQKAKSLAEVITLEEWRQSYPGNNPADAEDGIKKFREVIGKNLLAASKL